MTQITLSPARLEDAEHLTAIMKKTFDEEARTWLGALDSPVVDYNIQPPGYDSLHTTRYMIEELVYYKIMLEGQLIGGIILTLTGNRFGRIDRIFIDPVLQGKGLGSEVIRIVEEAHSSVMTWDLETSERQKGNLHFYEKMGFTRTFETVDEVGFIKRIHDGVAVDKEFESCDLGGATFYQANLADSAFCNSTLSGAHFSNINLGAAKFQNINFRDTLMADLNLSGSRIKHVEMSGVAFSDTTVEGAPVSFDRCELIGTRFNNCTMADVEINACDISGMKIDGVPIEELMSVYKKAKLF
ncbi:GNAT family N-acetyltransferase [Sutcliffiella horikoshii]|uniref:GNAT family N-acetyltransferase n=1 Tax=Sutcliffiella horikoshii TaxID=79883 RepID=UPI002042151B|nr:GNAT family N-acetyltransferase [Sutcliffiella horikoshii]MCM3618668.1 GNAT family N-acetyltransferase [Sutcliffiella horikoshii]